MRYDNLEAVLTGLAADHDDTLEIVDGAHLAAENYPQVNPGHGLLIRMEAASTGSTEGGARARKLQALLELVYPPEHAITLAGAGAQVSMPLSELGGTDRGMEWLFVPPLQGAADYTALQNIAARLRAPDGCPWDRALTWDKLRASLLEETHELLAALDAGDATAVAEEQGDLLLQVALQTQIALEEGLYRFPDVIRHIVDKLIRRHPHVFGDEVAHTAEEVLANWEAIKRAERAGKNEKSSLLAGVPKGLPALAQAEAYIDRVSRVRSVEAPRQPWAELASANATNGQVTGEMVGDALLGLVAWARAHGVEAESALREANARYAAEVRREIGD